MMNQILRPGGANFQQRRLLSKLALRFFLAAVLTLMPLGGGLQTAYSASAINIVVGVNGSGTQDANLTADGKILFGDPSIGGNTVSSGALLALGAGVDVVIQSNASITVDDLGGNLILPAGAGHTVTLSTAAPGGADIRFLNPANTLTTSGAGITMSAGGSLTAGSLNSNGGSVALSAGLNSPAGLEAQSIQTNSAGAISLQAANPAGGAVTLSGLAGGTTILVQAQDDITLGGVSGGNVTLSSSGGAINTSGAGVLKATGLLSLAAASGISAATQAAGVTAANSLSGNIRLSQAAAPAQPLSVANAGVQNNAPGGQISLTNLGSSLSVNGPIASSDGDLALSATDLDFAASLNSGLGSVILTHAQNGGQYDLGSEAGGKLGLTQADLDQISTARLVIGSSASGGMEISAGLTWLKTSLTLISGLSLSEGAAGALTLNALRIAATGPVTLTQPNNVGMLAGSSASGLAFSNGANPLSIGIVDSSTGLNSAGSAVRLIADQLDIQRSISALNSVVTIEPYSTTTAIDIGSSDGPGVLGLLENELGKITADVVRLGNSANSGGINFSRALGRQIGFSSLTLLTGASITQSSLIDQANLRAEGGQSVVLTDPGNNVDNLALASGGNILYKDANGVTVGSVDGAAGVRAGGSTTLTTLSGGLAVNGGIQAVGVIGLAPGGPLTQAADGLARLQAEALAIGGTGPITLTNVSNAIKTLAVNLSGSGSFENAGDLSVGSVTALGMPIMAGIQTSGSPFALRTLAGNLTINQPLNTGAGTLLVSAGSTPASPEHLLKTNSSLSGAGITLQADRMDLGGTIQAGAGLVQLAPTSAGRALELDQTPGNPSGLLRLGQSELNLISAGGVLVGDLTQSGVVRVLSAISAPAGWSVLRLVSPLGFEAGGTGSLQAGTLEFEDGGSSGRTWTVNPISVTLSGGTGVPYSGAGTLKVYGGSGQDVFNLTPGTGTAFWVAGGSPAPTAPGDSLQVDLTGAADPLLSTVCTLAGCSGAWTFSNRQAVNFAQIEQPFIRFVFIPLLKR